MNALLLTLTWLLPILLVPFALNLRHMLLPVLAIVPALLTIALVPVGTDIAIPWLMLGTTLGLDDTGRLLLLGSALVWFSAALYADISLRSDPHAGRFQLFFLLAMAGSFLLIVAQEALGFYLGYALMGIAAYGLLAHRRSTRARRAARTYLRWTIGGELILFSALVSMAAGVGPDALGFTKLHDVPLSDGVMLLLILAFGIKLAVAGLHVWQPLAYATATPAAAAVLSGAMINAGLLGWMRFMPIGEAGYAGWGHLLIGVGMFSAFYGVAIGLLQRRAKVVLAYSSMSQMGLLTAGIGLALAEPSYSTVLLLALTVYALHHGLAKGALFLVVDAHAGNRAGRWTFILMVVFALALAGAPLSSGAIAKGLYKQAVPIDWTWLTTLLTISTVATTLLMARLLMLAYPQKQAAQRLPRSAWLALLLPLICGPAISLSVAPLRLGDIAFAGIGPVLAGTAIAWLVMRHPALLRHVRQLRLPPGDIPLLIIRRLQRSPNRLDIRRPWTGLSMPSLDTTTWLVGTEARIRQWPVSGAGWLLLCLLIVALTLL